MKNRTRSSRSVMWIYFGILFAVSVVAFLCLYWVWETMKSQGATVDFWTLIQACSALFTATAVLGGGFIAYHELNEISDSRYLEVANQLFEELNSPENIHARRLVYQGLPENPAESIHAITPELRDAIKTVLNSLDRIAFLTQAGWIPVEVIMPWAHPMIAKAWIKLEPYVVYERKRRNEPYYYQYASMIAGQCFEWRKKNLPDLEDVRWVGDAL